MNYIKTIVFALLFAMLPIDGAYAADPAPAAKPTVDAGGFFAKMDGAVREVGRKAGRDLSKSLKTSGYTIAATMNNTALGIAGALGLMYLLYEVMQFLSGRTKSMLQVLFDVGIPCIFAAAFITQYGKLLPMFEGFLDVFRNLAGNTAGGADEAFNGILNVYTSVVGKITEAVQTAFLTNAKTISMWDGASEVMVSVVDLLVTILFALAILVLLLIGVAEVLGLLLIGPFLFAVGVAFGPIMIAGLVTPWTRDYFTKWLQFLVISAGLTGVINVIFTIAKQLMDTVQIGSETTGAPTAVGLVIIAILILTINSMISQAPSIASALFPGHVGVSKSSGGAVASAAKKASGGLKNGFKGARGTANGVIGAGQKSVKFAKSKMSGAKKPAP
jgi:type IV secretory pathway VirB6-like protein